MSFDAIQAPLSISLWVLFFCARMHLHNVVMYMYIVCTYMGNVPADILPEQFIWDR
jgi:hypothetical protein